PRPATHARCEVPASRPSRPAAATGGGARHRRPSLLPTAGPLPRPPLGPGRGDRLIVPPMVDEGAKEVVMGLIDFVVNAGKKLCGASDAEAAKSPAPAVQSKRVSALENEIKSLGLNVEGLKIKMAEQTVYVRGKVKTQADREKVVLALGNVEGVAKVDD